ncbi:hypothetical protein HK100_002664 [Physocladia obscura]|uniref:Glycosyltransferase family 71 protein n=1 Tax=Physocladia obscura TaxID=109957 RepID=A0AAD5SW17_9FUNG|nr:hypothetical protein HK100_002664 [Physocladia obscura]
MAVGRRILSQRGTIVLLLTIIASLWVWKVTAKSRRNYTAVPKSKIFQQTPHLLEVQAFESKEEIKALIEDAVRNALKKDTDIGKAQVLPLPPLPIQPAAPTLEELETNIDLMQARFLDFLNGEEGQTEKNELFGGSLSELDGQDFDIIGTWKHVHQYAIYVKSLDYNKTDFLQLGRRVRANLIAYSIFYDKPSLIPVLSTPEMTISAFRIQLSSIINECTALLYPWLQPTFSSIYAMKKKFTRDAATNPSENEAGLILCTGKWHFEMAVHAITTFRTVLNCTLPIEIHYGGLTDLTPQMLTAFATIPGVRTVNVLEHFPDETKHWGGWSIKPFAILASRFRRVAFIDADALFFQDPRVLFEQSQIFRHRGALFYHDRSLGRDDGVPWFKGINPVWTQYANGLRYMTRRSHHEQESGVVVVDKGRTGVLHALLMVCKLNSKIERDGMTYQHMHGDKETYWISFDMARVPYMFTPSYGGTVGYKNEKGKICGGLFHTDEFLEPLWWNGGVIANKHASKDNTFMEFEYAAFDTDGDKIEWDWETATTPFCLGPRYPKFEIIELSNKQKDMGAKFVNLYKDIKSSGGDTPWIDYFKRVYNVDL